MYFEEKIESLKKHFPATDFRIPFTDAHAILKTIEKHFIVAKDVAAALNNLSQYYSNWPELIKQKNRVATIAIAQFRQCLDQLEAGQNYWVVLGGPDNTKNTVYDCRPVAISSLLSLSACDFFIVDKKYNWFAAFIIDRQLGRLDVYRSGDTATPFG